MSTKTLIIDDDPRNIFAMAAILKSRGFQCLSATSAKEGIEQLKKDSDIKLVLLDMMMPDMDGYEALKIIRADQALMSVPVIAVTAQAMVGDREKCFEAGADQYIAKPVDIDKLLVVIASHINA